MVNKIIFEKLTEALSDQQARTHALLYDTFNNISDESNGEFTLRNNSDASFIHVLDNWYIKAIFNACADDVEWLTSSSHNKESFQGRLPSLIVEVHLPSDKRECAPGEEDVIHNLLLLAGDIETNPGPVVRL